MGGFSLEKHRLRAWGRVLVLWRELDQTLWVIPSQFDALIGLTQVIVPGAVLAYHGSGIEWFEAPPTQLCHYTIPAAASVPECFESELVQVPRSPPREDDSTFIIYGDGLSIRGVMRLLSKGFNLGLREGVGYRLVAVCWFVDDLLDLHIFLIKELLVVVW